MSKIITIGKKVINQEIEGLVATGKALDNKFEAIVNKILKCKGRVIISGMGKSGHIGNKIAATMASIGTPAFFIHPGEASHGDLGMISKDDIVLLLSNSGETKELVDIINYCKRFDIFMISFVRRKQSLLVEASDISIILPEIPEASSVNAPTTSTSMMLALGDAVAVAVAELKGFSKDDFGIYHPGGKIGSNFVKVAKIMRKGKDLPVVEESTKMSDALVIMTQKAMGCVAVVNKKGKLVGVVTDGDLRRHIEDDLVKRKAVEVMTKNPQIISKDALAVEAVSIMQNKKITSVFVAENEKPVGAVHIHDCFKAGII